MVRLARPAFLGLVLLLASAPVARAQDAEPPPVPAPPAPPRLPETPPPATLPLPPLPPGQHPVAPDDLDSLLALAMKANPEVLVAEAKVAQAQAEAHAARLRVSQAVLEARAQREQAAARREAVEQRRAILEGRVQAGMASAEEALAARNAVAEAKAAVAEADARIRYLCGLGATGSAPWSATEAWRAAVLRVIGPHGAPVAGAEASPTAPLPRRAAQDEPEALDRPYSTSYVDMPLKNVIEAIKGQTGIQVVVDRGAFSDFEYDELLGMKSTLTLQGPIPLRAYLEAVADSVGCTFVPRRYGALLTKRVPPVPAESGAGPR